MIIELPEKFDYRDQELIIDGILKIPEGIERRDFMYNLTLATKDNKCWYCGRTLKKDEVTMDHLYPQDLGGPTITNNLAPTCSECNKDKSNLTEQQYRQIMECSVKQGEKLREQFIAQNEQYKIRKGYYLPKDWVCEKEITYVIHPWYVKGKKIGKKYHKIKSFYDKYCKLPYPIVVDRNNYLLDGFLVLKFAMNNNILQVPTIILENVEVVNK